MRSIRALIFVFALAATSAGAQEMYPGQNVTVNPAAAGTRVLMYPGGQYVRVLPPLLQPGQNLAPIHLHMPVHHKVARVRHEPKVASEVPAPADTVAPAPETPAPVEAAPPPKPKHTRKTEAATASPPPAPAAADDSQSNAAIPFSFDGGASAPPPPAKSKPAKVATAEPPPAQTAPASKSPEGFTKRGEIVFKHDATDPAPAQYDGLKLLAGDLNSALQGGATRIQLQAFGGTPGDKGSDARRLSLKRALAIRQVLIDNGVPSGKIDVRAMGGIDDHGNADRVDVLVRSS